MNEKEKILKDNFNEYFELGEEAFKERKYNSAVTLFFKSIGAITDLFILKKEGFVPSSHTHRSKNFLTKNLEIYYIFFLIYLKFFWFFLLLFVVKIVCFTPSPAARQLNTTKKNF